MDKKIVYILGGASEANGMSQVLTQKINFLAENTTYKIYAILTENTNKPLYYKLSDKVEIINFNINFDELDTKNIIIKLILYFIKQKKYKRCLSNYLLKIKPNITISAMRREINFINDIKDGSKKIGELHFSKSHYRYFHKKYLPNFINKFITKIWRNKLIKEIKRLDRFIVLSDEDRAQWTEINNIETISNPLKENITESSSCDNKRVIAVGRYTEQKGFDMLLQAWKIINKNHNDWHLDIYGSGDNLAYQKMANELNLNNTVACHKSEKKIYEKYLDSSIFAFSSRYEGFGLVLAEAMSCGIPAVSFSCPCGPKDIINDGVDGILVEPNNIKSFAEKISFLIDNEKIRKGMGKNAKLDMNRYNEDNIMQKWLTLFRDILDH